MPPRYTYWTIILEGMPTAFRAHTQDELLPTLRQLQSKHPDAVMKWFARGRLWHTPEEERMAAAMKRRPASERRPPAWRPGGEHRDPREKFKVPRDEKRARFASKLRRERMEGPRDTPKEGRSGPPAFGGSRKPGVRPAGDRRPPGPRGPARPNSSRPPHSGSRGGSGGGGGRGGAGGGRGPGGGGARGGGPRGGGGRSR